MSVFRTPITRLLGIRTPVISGVMTGASGGLLAATVTKAGGFGFMSAARAPSLQKISDEIALARTTLSSSDVKASPLPIGVGFFGFELDASPPAVEILDMVLTQNVRAIWFSFGTDIGKWVRYVRERDTERRIAIFVQLPTAAEARKAEKEWGVDVVVLQGSEAGGHSMESATPIVSLVPETLRSVSIPVLAAGGLVSGSHLASMLALGASGVVIGTRFSTSLESTLPHSKKERLIAAGEGSTYLSTMYDELIGRKWPDGTTARGLRMDEMVKDWSDGKSVEERRRIFGENSGEGGTHEVVWAGTSVGLVYKIESAEDIVHEIHDEALKAIQSLLAKASL